MSYPAPPGKSYLPYQEKAIAYCLGAKGTILADEMGLGKTVQAIGVINATKPSKILIVCPKTLKFNWSNELDAWLTSDATKSCYIAIVSYGEAKKQLGLNWDLLILDEGQYCKNNAAKRTQIAKEIAKRSARVLILTGTPINNRVVEIWPLLQMAAPQHWDPPTQVSSFIKTREVRISHPGEGPHFWAFAKRYCDAKKTRFRVGNRWETAWDFTGSANLDELNKKLRETCMVRRLKKDVLPELPEKRRQLILLKGKKTTSGELIGDVTEENYETVVKELQTNKVLFEEWSTRRHEEALAKVDECIEIIEDALDSSPKIVVFAHHQDVIDKLVQYFEQYHSIVSITGKTKTEDRQRAVEKFQSDESCRLFIGSIGAAGVGITLTAASHMIFVELSPVPGDMNQAEDREHRIGQKNSVLIWHLLLDGSICAKIAKILVKKQAVISAALDATSI